MSDSDLFSGRVRVPKDKAAQMMPPDYTEAKISRHATKYYHGRGASAFLRIERDANFVNDLAQRLLEKLDRDQRDTRTAAEQWLGDPPPFRSALAQRRRRVRISSRV